MAEHRKPDQDEEHVRAALRDAADSYRPDRAAMLDRVAGGRAGRVEAPRRNRPLFSIRPVAAAAAAVTAVVFSMFAVRFADAGNDREDVAVDKPPAAVVQPVTPASSAPAPRPGTPGSRDTPPPAVPATRPPATVGGEAPVSAPPVVPPASVPAAPPSRPPHSAPPTAGGGGWLTAAGELDRNSSDAWSQNTVTVRNSKPITELEIVIQVARTADAADAGRFTTAGNNSIAVTVTTEADALRYSFTLRDGVTLKPGRYAFAAQYTHRAGHQATTEDSFRITAAAEAADMSATGGFVAG